MVNVQWAISTKSRNGLEESMLFASLRPSWVATYLHDYVDTCLSWPPLQKSFSFFVLFLLAIWGKSRDGKCERMSLGIFQIETQLGDSQIRNFERCFVKEYLHIRNCRANDATQQFKDLRWPHCSVVAVDWLAEGVNRLFTLCKSPIDTEKGNHRRMLN